MNDLSLVLAAVDLLAAHGARTWVFGGWGEELRGLAAPRTHSDVDLLYPAPDWSRVDAIELEWIAAKRSSHRRAFELDGVLVEVVLVRRDRDGWFTDLQDARFDWPPNVFAARGRLPVASAAALEAYRDAWSARLAA